MFSTLADVQIDESNDNVLTSNPEHLNQRIVRRGSRAGWYEMTYKFKWATVSPGPLFRFLSQGDYLAIRIKDSGGKARLYKRAVTRIRSRTPVRENPFPRLRLSHSHIFPRRA